jgi:hypothetical protein
MWGRGMLGKGMGAWERGQGNGGKEIKNDGGQPAAVLFIPLPYIPLPLLRAPDRRLVRRIQVSIRVG